MINIVIYLVAIMILLLTLLFSSIEDIKYHRISKRFVLIILLTVWIYNILTVPTVEKTLAFLITLGIFSGFTFFSRGGFGFGDTLILGALGWFIGDLRQLQYFFLVLAFCTLIIEAYFILKYRKENEGIKSKLFNNFKMVPVDQLRPGMILANDYFMKGLTEFDIMELKKKCDTTIKIKQAYPYIPIIFVSFLIYAVVIVNLIV